MPNSFIMKLPNMFRLTHRLRLDVPVDTLIYLIFFAIFRGGFRLSSRLY